MGEDKKDIALAIFINRMKIAFLRKRIKYINKINEMNSFETELSVNETIFSSPFEAIKQDELNALSKDEIEILNLFYIYGYSYKEISKMKNEKVETIRKRRNRAVSKIRRKDYGL